MGEAIRVAVFSEDGFEFATEFDDVPMARAFASGVSTGAGFYSGSATAYVLPEDAEDLAEQRSPEDLETALKAKVEE